MTQISGIKYDQDKVRMELLPPDALYEVARALTAGAKKYEDRNWELGMNHGRLLGAALRHINAYERGEEVDPELKIDHVALATCNLLMLLALRLRDAGLDDRSPVFISEPVSVTEEQVERAVNAALEDYYLDEGDPL